MEDKKTVLIVEDDDLYREFLVKYFTKKSFDVTAVPNGFDALNETEKKEFSLVLTDIRMPKMDGIEFLRRLRDKNKSSNVIVITAHGEMDSYLKALDWGAFDYLHKPIDINELSAVIDKMLAI